MLRVHQSGSQCSGWAPAASCSQASRAASQSILAPVRRYTNTRRTPSQPPMASASSAMRLSGSVLPPRTCSSAVISRRAPMSTMRSFSDLAEKPPKTTEWIAPIRLQACMATMASTDMGR